MINSATSFLKKSEQELNETYEKIEDNMTLTETKASDGTETVYEDEYAGSYIDDDKLVVCVTEKPDAGDSICDDTENVEYRVVEHSYNKLSTLQDELSDTYSDLYDRYPEGSEENGDKIEKNNYMTSVAKGSRVYKVGATTYRTAATVKNTKWSGIVEDCILKNLASTGKFSDEGDSGGLVYTLYKNKYIPAGIITAGDKNMSTYTKASEIVSAINVYPY